MYLIKFLRKLFQKTRHLSTLWTIVFVALIAGTTFLVLNGFEFFRSNYVKQEKVEFKNKASSCDALLVEKWQESYKIGYRSKTILSFIKVEFKLGDRTVSSQAQTSYEFGVDYPEIGDSLLIYYSPEEPEVFKPYWDY